MTLLCLLYDTGARVQEVCDLRVRDVRLEKPELITLTGKGSKSRYVPLLGNTVNLLRTYMMENALLQNRKQDMPLFCNQRRTALTRGGITHILQKYVDKASLECVDMPKKVRPHVLRHSKAMHLLKAGVNLVYIRDILGHVSIQTMVYERYADDIVIHTRSREQSGFIHDRLKQRLRKYGLTLNGEKSRIVYCYRTAVGYIFTCVSCGDARECASTLLYTRYAKWHYPTGQRAYLSKQ
ncbi:hypothetical protein AGMMS50239_25940 [Bacteroidia bacterium]|nr:hypothetical protein AGMMS50239_25940 [Bacteroidia bacterium]